MATIKDLARATGLSVATVSKFINGGNVLPENRTLLERAVKKTGYRTNSLARALKTRCSMTVGVLIPRFNNVFYSALVSGIETQLSRCGYSTIVCAYHDDPAVEREKLDFLLGKSVDGIIMTPLGAASRCLPLLRDAALPVVMVDRVCEGIGCDMVLSDNFNAAANAVRYLAVRGHRRIGIVVGPEGVFTADERLDGYRSALRTLGLDSDPDLVRRGNYSLDSGNRCLHEFLALPRRPTAVIITNYEMTVGGVIALAGSKIAIPDELSIIGFDHLELAQVINPPLTMVVQQIDKMAEAAVAMLLKRIAEPGDNSFSVKKFPTELVERESVKKINSA